MNVFDLFAKIALDTSEYEKGMDDASGKTSSFADKLKSGFSAIGKAAAVGIGAASTAIVGIGKAAIENYADYEQLAGGVETLFGAGGKSIEEYAQSVGKTVDAVRGEYDRLMASQSAVMENASNAYMTAGMSANEYMETVTSFSASLLQGLDGDTETAAKIADKAITDMSDNANKMGTDISMIQNAYQGFAKQNYTMLDNLKLGYGGTATEMARLINDSGVLGEGIEVTADTVNSVSFDKIIEAIGVVQDEMGITGTTSEEAAGTISGSIGMMKSAWSNLLTGMADPEQDFEALAQNVIDSVITVAQNIVPRIAELLPTIANGLTMLVSGLVPLVPPIIEDLIPSLLTGAAQLIGAVFSALPDILNVAVTSIFGTLATFMTENMPAITEKGGEILTTLTDGLAAALPVMISYLPEIISSLVTFIAKNLPVILDCGITILKSLVSGLIGAIPELVAAIPEIIYAIDEAMYSMLGSVVELGKDIVRGIWEGISAMASWIGEKVSGFFSGIVSGAKSLLGIHSPSTVFAGIGGFMAEGLGEGWDEEYGKIKRDITDGLNFGTASVDFASSGFGAASAAMVNSVSAVSRDSGAITINLMLPDMTKIASYMLDPLAKYASANGTPILNPS